MSTPIDPQKQADAMRYFYDRRIDHIRSVMTHDDACDQIVPSDLRVLVGEIDRLRTEVERLKKDVNILFQ